MYVNVNIICIIIYYNRLNPGFFTDQINVVNVKLITIMKDIKQGESWKDGNEAFIW